MVCVCTHVAVKGEESHRCYDPLDLFVSSGYSTFPAMLDHCRKCSAQRCPDLRALDELLASPNTEFRNLTF